MISLGKMLIAGWVFTLLLGCASYDSTKSAQNTSGIDPMNRNVLETQGSTIRDRTSERAPPIRPAYSSDRY